MSENIKNLEGINIDYAVQMRNVCKRFGKVQANNNVNLKVISGHIHGLVGENGAGKSTLMSILYGFYGADSGEILLHQKPVQIRFVEDAIKNGVDMVHQHFMLVNNMSALENIILGSEGAFVLRKANTRARARLEELMLSTGMRVNLDAKIEDLTVGDCQRIEILKTLYRGANTLILDEPTAVLTPQETLQLFEVLGKLRKSGTTIIIITHKLKEVMHLCDEVTVMRGGEVVLDVEIKNTSIQDLAKAMVGRSVSLERITAPENFGKTLSENGNINRHEKLPLLSAQNLNINDRFGVSKLKDVSLELKAGTIVGVAGVSGNGQSELLDLLSGLIQPSQGKLTIGEKAFTPKNWLEPTLARKLGVAHVPEDRYARAMVMKFTAWEDEILGYENLARYSKAGWMLHDNMIADTQKLMEQFDVRPPNPYINCASFSGGNQQKQVLAREINQNPKILLIGQPTRGVDIGAIEFIHNKIRKMRDEGCAVLLVSSELDEILALSDRVIVMNAGEVTGELDIADCTEAKIGLLMAGEKFSVDNKK